MVAIARGLLILLGALGSLATVGVPPACWGAEPRPLVLVVMDPLAAPLSCPCVKGYAQRDYAKLGEYLQEKLEREILIKFGESLERALVDVAGGRADLIIGKHSVVLADAQRLGQKVTSVAALTGKDGSSTQRGLILVRTEDPAQTLADLQDYRVILGPAECDEKNGAARALFARQGILLPVDCPISAACSDGAAEVVDTGAQTKVATVISSYAHKLLEGCGTIKKGDLRLLAETADVPFVEAFVDAQLEEQVATAITSALLEVRTQPLLRLALESKGGFQAISPKPSDLPANPQEVSPAVPGKKSTSSFQQNGDWPGWRGSQRDAVVAYLPEQLPAEANWTWKKTLLNEGLGSPAVAQGIAVVGDRDPADEFDVFHAVDAATGQRRWSLRYAAAGRLDYGNSPRATPLIAGEYVYLQGAFGHLHCVRVSDGKIVWKKNLRADFAAKDELVWGACSSPLLVAGKLIVNPGAAGASLVALEPTTGEVLWKTAGAPPAFASLIAARVGQRQQIMGFDKSTCGGWDIATGQRLWSLKPHTPGDFNVPTPVIVGDKLLLTSENNGTRLIGLTDDFQPQELASFNRCAPDMHTPVLAGDRIFAVHKNKVFCFAAADLRLLWSATDRSLAGHVSLIASAERVLLLTQAGELVLLDARANQLAILSRLKLFDEEVSLYTHPVIVGDSLYIRGPGHLFCLRLT